MKKKIISFYTAEIIVIFAILFSGCASKPRFKGHGDLCGLVIDENNKPIKDFVVYCQPVDTVPQIVKPVITNESGLFVFYDVSSGKYLLSGEKNNYLRISKTSYNFDDRTKIFCMQTKSLKAALETVEEKLRLNQKDDAEELLKNICCESKSPEENLINAYLFFTTDKNWKRKNLISHLKHYKGAEHDFFNQYAEKLEEGL